MTKLSNALIAISLIFLFYSCGVKSDVIERMEEIKCVGDKNPEMALNMIDSLNIQIREESEYTQRKYDLLKTRLKDKAYIKHTNDITIIKILHYFEDNGSINEKQEAYYYAGSVYRDLQDTPRALDYFHLAEEVAENNPECDSVILRNTYSQIHVLMYSVQDYKKAYEYALKEYGISAKINKVDLTSLNHVGISYLCLDSISKAKMWFDIELDSISKQTDLSKYADNIYSLLYNYSLMRDKERSTVCYNLSKTLDSEGVYTDKYIALGEYYLLQGKTDSAIICYNYRITHNNNLTNKYDVSKSLFKIYAAKGTLDKAIHYASMYVDACDSLDLGRRQELASTVNNQFQYHFDKEKEIKIQEEKDKFRFMVIIVSVVSILCITFLGLLLLYRKNRYMKRLLKLSKELDGIGNTQEEVEEMISEKKIELNSSRKTYKKTEEEFETLMKKIHQISIEIEEQNKELKNNEKILRERIEQNKSLFSLIHKAKLETDSKDVVDVVRKSSLGVKDMTSSQWEQLYVAIDELYPDFKQLMTDKLGRFSELQMQVCYLLKIGLSNTKIMNMTGVAKTTLWRWVKRYNWVLTNDMQ